MLGLLLASTQVVTVSCGDINTLVDRAKAVSYTHLTLPTSDLV